MGTTNILAISRYEFTSENFANLVSSSLHVRAGFHAPYPDETLAVFF